MTLPNFRACRALVAVAAAVAGFHACAQDRLPLTLAGQVHYDLTRFSEAPSPLRDASAFRRLRLALVFGESGHTQGKFQYDFANSRWIDAYVRQPWADGELTVGQFRPAFSADISLSSTQAFFTENAAANAFSPGRRLGVQYAQPGWAVGLYSRDVHGVGPDYAAAARGYLSGASAAGLWHLGASTTFERPQSGSARLSLRPDVGPESGSWLSSPRYTASSHRRMGIEAALQKEQWLLQGEWFHQAFDAAALPLDHAEGGFVTAAWTLHGAPRRYKSGFFGTPAPVNGGLGNVELALRYSAITLPASREPAAKQRSVSIGLNAQIGEQWRLQLDRHQSRRRGGLGFELPDAGAWTLRAQWVY